MMCMSLNRCMSLNSKTGWVHNLIPSWTCTTTYYILSIIFVCNCLITRNAVNYTCDILWYDITCISDNMTIFLSLLTTRWRIIKPYNHSINGHTPVSSWQSYININIKNFNEVPTSGQNEFLKHVIYIYIITIHIEKNQ